MTDEKLIIACIPSLVSQLLAREREKGAPLTEDEVLAIRDNSMAVALPVEAAAAVESGRGYQDINPERCWQEWQQARLDLLESK